MKLEPILNRISWVALLFVMLLGGCETTRESARIEGRVVSNQSVGYDGYRFLMPSGYIHYDLASNAGKNSWGDFIHDVSQDFLKGLTGIRESFIFVDARCGISVSIAESNRRRAYSDYYEDERLRALGRQTHGVIIAYPDSWDKERSVIKVGDHDVGRVSSATFHHSQA